MEVSEPPSPGEADELPHPEGPSILASMLRKYPTGTDPQRESEETHQRLIDEQVEAGSPDIQPIEALPPPAAEVDAGEAPGETTPLLRQTSGDVSYVNDPSADRARHADIEGQKGLGPRRWLANITDYGTHAKSNILSGVSVVGHPNQWNRKALWETVVVRPVACLPAVIVGLLLNILDALSYG